MEYVSLSDIAFYKQGKQISIDKQSLTCEHGMVRFVRIIDFTNPNEPSRYIENPGEQYMVGEKDIVMIRYGSQTAGTVVRGIPGVIANNMFQICIKNSGFDINYMYYYLASPFIKQMLMGGQSSSTMPAITFGMLKQVQVPVRPIEEQRKIAAFLERIDKKIEINVNINDNLQQQIQAIYQKWFSASEQINERGILANICDYSRDRIALSGLSLSSYYSTENMLPGKGGAINVSCLPTIAQTTKGKAGDVLVSNIRPYFKKIVYCHSECGCSTDVLCFTPKKPELSAYLYSTLYADCFFDFMVAGSKGTKMPRGDKRQIMTYPVIIPSNDKLRIFNAIAIPILSHIEGNRVENVRLSLLRDTLLPKLMSGEIDVSNIQ